MVTAYDDVPCEWSSSTCPKNVTKIYLQNENVKLRALVRDMWHRAMYLMDSAERYAFASEFIDRMRELEE